MVDRHNEFDGRPELVKMRVRTILIQRVIACAIILFMIICLSLLSYNALQSVHTRSTLLDCTVPEGECYQEGQKRTEEAITRLIEANAIDEATTRAIVVLAVSCSDETDSQSVQEIQECVDRKLKVRQGGE